MFTILLVQFDSFRQVVIVMSAIVFSTAGVLVALLVMGRLDPARFRPVCLVVPRSM